MDLVIETVLIVTQDVKGLSRARQGKNISMFDRIRDQAKKFCICMFPCLRQTSEKVSARKTSSAQIE